MRCPFGADQSCFDNIAIEFEYNLATMTRVKVCGITTPDDACLAAEYGADAVGLIFAESSRKVSLQEAREIAAALPDDVLKVGVFLDAYSERVRGGTGERFDWVLAKSLKGRGNIVISGGLTPENVREAIRFFEPYGVDASSSLEDAPGKKNAERVRRFVSAAKG